MSLNVPAGWIELEGTRLGQYFYDPTTNQYHWCDPDNPDQIYTSTSNPKTIGCRPINKGVEPVNQQMSIDDANEPVVSDPQDKMQAAQSALADLLFNDEIVKKLEKKAEKILNSYRRVKVTVETKTPLEPQQLEEATHSMFPNLLKAITCGNVALIGPTGCGKTTIARQIADTLGLDFHMNGALHSEFKLTGFIDAKGDYITTPFRKAFQDGGVYLFDEIDASSANVLLQFNAALANGYTDFPDGVIQQHEHFYCIAAANTYWTGRDREYVGRNQLDAATMDRFIFMEMSYDEEMERSLCDNPDWVDKVIKVRSAIKKLNLRHIVSPRASIVGAKMLRAGISVRAVEDALIWKQLDSSTKTKIRKEMDNNE